MSSLALILALAMQPWGSLTRTDRIVILGLPNSGKSWHAEKLVADAHRAVFFDPAGDYDKPGRLCLTPAELERWPRLLKDPHTRIVIQPKGESSRELADELAQIVRLCKTARDLVLVLDEVGDYRQHAEGTINGLFRRGRHEGLATVLVSQVATDIPLTCRRIASTVYCLAQHHEQELAALEAIYGREFAARVAAWRPYQAPITWRPHT